MRQGSGIAQSTLSPEKAAAKWNQRFPVGTRVHYWSVLPDARGRGGKAKYTVTRSEAYVLSGHTAVVFVEGVSGCVALSHLDPLPGGAR